MFKRLILITSLFYSMHVIECACQTGISIYFGGPLFSIQEITGNQLLANAIERLSKKKYCIVLPQRLFQIHTDPKKIRNDDLRHLLAADIGLFNFNGVDLDDGTVVEYMFSVFSNKPSLLLRTDFRNESKTCIPFNIMLDFYPRTKKLFLDALGLYHENNLNLQVTIDQIATRIIQKLDALLKVPPILVGNQKRVVDNWIQKLIRS